MQELNKNKDFFLVLSDNLSMSHVRNMYLHLGQELYAPDYIFIMDDDHGFRQGLIFAMIEAMKKYYGKVSPNGLRYGMFSRCFTHTRAKLEKINDIYTFPILDNEPFAVGGFNSCFRCTPTSHWNNVLKRYDTDEF